MYIVHAAQDEISVDIQLTLLPFPEENKSAVLEAARGITSLDQQEVEEFVRGVPKELKGTSKKDCDATKRALEHASGAEVLMRKWPKFWLVAHIQDCRVVTAQETASAKCYLKLYWLDTNFPEKIRAKQRTLIDPRYERAQQTKDLDLEKMAVELERGDVVYGVLDAAPGSFPINVDLIFLNQISAERIASLCWIKYDEEADETRGQPEAGLVSVSGLPSNS